MCKMLIKKRLLQKEHRTWNRTFERDLERNIH